MNDIEKWLTKEELKGCHSDHTYSITDARLQKALESLARRAELLDKHQWIFVDDSWCWVCFECGASHKEKTDDMLHKPDCAIAAELEGLPRGGK